MFLSLAFYGIADRLDRDALVRRIGSRVAIELLKAGLPAFVVQRDHLPKVGVKHRAARATAFRRRSIVHAGDSGDLSLATRRSLMVEQLVVLARKGKIAPARMPNDVDHRRRFNHRKPPRDWQRLDARDWILQAQNGGIVAVGRGG